MRVMLRRMASRLPASFVDRAYRLKYAVLPFPHNLLRPYSMLSNLNMYFLHELAERVIQENVPGCFVECGVYRGGSAGLLAHRAMQAVPTRPLWLFDVFGGYPDAGEADRPELDQLDQFEGSLADTQRILHQIGFPHDCAHLVQGRIEETLPGTERFTVALLHIDCTFHDAVRTSLETLYDRVPAGGYIVFNDYGCYAGYRRAVDDFFASRSERPGLVRIDQDAYFMQKN